MEPGKVVFESKTKDGRDFILRYPKTSDLEQLYKYINKLSLEQTFIRFQGEQVTLEQEKEVLDRWLKLISENKMVQLLATSEVELIGVCDLVLQEKTESHVGIFGITVAKEFRNQGLGKILMEKVFEEAEKNLPNLKIIELTCFANNNAALKLYREAGFQEFGRLPGGLSRKGEYIDQIYMFKKIR